MPRISVGKLNMSNETINEDPMPNENLIPLRDAIIAFLRQTASTLSSFDRIIGNVPNAATYSQLHEVVNAFPQYFRPAKIKGGLPGLALLPTAPATNVVPEVEMTVSDIQVAPLETSTVYDGNTPVGVTAPVEVPVPVVMPIDPTMPSLSAPPTAAPVDPEQAVVDLIGKAASQNNSSAAENFAKAALDSAQALFTLKQLQRQFKAE